MATLLDEALTDFDEVRALGRISRALDLIERTGVDFEPTYFPMYFTGDFQARLVLVHLNPKLNDRLAAPGLEDFESYVDAHRRFGYHHWVRDPTYRSAFDHKQVRFLRPFGTINFSVATDLPSRRRNAALAIDAKLQLELVPYPSHSFPAHRFTSDVLRPHFARVLGVAAAYPRDYFLFCGAIFDELLEKSGLLLSKQEYRFRLPTSRGQSKNDYRFSNVIIDYDGAPLHAGVARSFAIRGIPMTEYGQMCRTLYRSAD